MANKGMTRAVSPPPTKRVRPSDLASGRSAPGLPTRTITSPRQDDLRVFTWNVNGISAFLQTSITSFFTKAGEDQTAQETGSSEESTADTDSPSLGRCLKRWGYPQVACLQEVKIAPSDIKTQDAVKKAVRQLGYMAMFSLPRDRYNARGFGGKVYGVCTLVAAHTLHLGGASRIRMMDWDLEGRVLTLELPDYKVAVFNVYAVNGTENPYRDPRTGTLAGTRHDLKRVFHTKLRDECRQYERRGWLVVVAGDLNIARSPIDGFLGIRSGAQHVQNRCDFEAKFISNERGLGMLDSFRYLHGDEKKYSYRARGIEWGTSCDRVDLILVSSQANADGRKILIEADILDEEIERGPSDHLPCYATLDLRSWLATWKDANEKDEGM